MTALSWLARIAERCKPQLLALVLLLVGAEFGRGEPTPQLPGTAGTKPEAALTDRPITPELIDSRRKLAEQSADLSDEVKKKVADFYRQALEAVNRAQELAGRAASHKEDAETVERRGGDIRRQIDLLRGKTPALPDLGPLSAWEQEVARLDRRLGELKQAQQQAEAEPSARANRRKEARTLLLSAPQRLQELDKQLEAPPPADESPLLTLARRTELLARQAVIDQEVPALQNELAKYDAEDSVDLVGLQRDLCIQEVAFAERECQRVGDRVKQLREEAAREAVRKAQEEAIGAQPLLQDFAARNRELAEEAQLLTQSVEQTELAKQQVSDRLEEVVRQFTQIKDRVDSVGLTGSVGALLRKQRAMLPDVRKQRQRIRARRETIDDARFKLFELDDERRELAQPEALVKGVLQQAAGSLSDAERQQLQAATDNVLERKREYLDTLIRNYNSYFDSLIALDTTEQQLVNLTEEYVAYIDERVLWIRSGKPLTAGVPISESDLWLVTPSQWAVLAERVGTDVGGHLDIYLTSLAVLTILFASRQRLRQQISEVGKAAERKTCTRFSLTLRAVAFTALLAAPWPALTAFVAWRLNPSPSGPDLLRAVAAALWELTLVLFPLEFARQLCRKDGLAESHFDWPRSAVQKLRANATGLMITGTPLVFVTSVLYASSPEYGNDALGRVFFIVGAGAVAIFLGRVLRPTGGVLHEYVAYHRDGWVGRLGFIWRWAGVVASLAIAALAFFGYYYTAFELAWRLYFTILSAFLLVVVRSLLLRLLLVHRRQLSMRQARERRAAALAAQESAHGAEGTSLTTMVAVDAVADLAALSTQTQRLLTTGIVVASVLALWFSWVDVLPAFGVANRWSVWTTVVTVTETHTDEAGNTEITAREMLEKVTVADLLLACLLGIVTLVAFRNIPGLMEMSLLQRLPLDASVRYAITTLASYVIIVIGIFVACATVGLRWSQIQWLATALTFGLAFGLQEIFANFVAGLIILFERPIRVGDVVTVGDVTGVVSRMRVRATTITDWDRKEYVVPNKEFITGRVLNWTLSDQVNRVVINVGIAYGSDTERARGLLLQTARTHPLVLQTPPPVASFEGFGDSSLSLVLRLYLPNLEHRLDVIHDLHTAIYKRFAEAGIEIAFPQLELHVRTALPELQQKRPKAA